MSITDRIETIFIDIRAGLHCLQQVSTALHIYTSMSI
jgi:hypothetical protein